MQNKADSAVNIKTQEKKIIIIKKQESKVKQTVNLVFSSVLHI